MFTDYYFWFSSPSYTLIPADKLFFWIFFVVTAVGLTAWVANWFIRDGLLQRVFSKITNFACTIGFSGLFWFFLRYENTPIFANRYWAALVFVAGLIWLGFVLKYVTFDFKKERANFTREQLKNKYLPNKK